MDGDIGSESEVREEDEANTGEGVNELFRFERRVGAVGVTSPIGEGADSFVNFS